MPSRGATSRIGRTSNVTATRALSMEIDRIQPPADCSQRYRQEWERMVNDLPADHFRESDRPIMETYISQYLMLKDMTAEMQGQSFTMDLGHGEKENPLLGTIVKYTSKVMSLASKLRLTPNSRTQVSTATKGAGLAQSKALKDRKEKATGVSLVA